jgi:hypothetical protein
MTFSDVSKFLRNAGYMATAVAFSVACSSTAEPLPTQDVSGKPYFQGTNDITDPSQPQIHVHLRFTQSGRVLGRPADCEPLPAANCDLLPRNAAGATAIGALDDTQGGSTGIAATVTDITGTLSDPGITFTITLKNGRVFRFTGTVTNSDAMNLTMSGATIPTAISIVLSRTLD